MSARRSPYAAGLAVCLTVGAVAGCLPTDTPDSPTQPSDVEPRPMEQVLDDYQEMLRAIISALEADPGDLIWEELEPSALRREACGEGSGGAEKAVLQTLYATDAYEGPAMERAVDVVSDVSATYGFAELSRSVRDDHAAFSAEDQGGGRLGFGTDLNSVLTVWTGCHEWADDPGPDHTLPPVLNRDGAS